MLSTLYLIRPRYSRPRFTGTHPDPDGQAEKYRYWIGASDAADSVKTETFETNISIRLDFADQTSIYPFNVQARDNAGVWDSSPARVELSLAEVRRGITFAPNTEGVTVPNNGDLTSRGVHFVVKGTDIDGTVPMFQWAVDDPAVWTDVIPQTILDRQSTLEFDLLPSVISLGIHVVYIRAIDNYGNIDESPLTISFIAVDSLRPDLSVVSGAIPNAFYFLPQGGNTVDLATGWDGDATWYFSTLQYRYAVDDTTNWSALQTPSSATLTGLTAGPHIFYVQAIDLAGNSTTYSTHFGIGQMTGTRGILLVNGIDWVQYSGESIGMYTDNAPVGTHPFHFWDLFTNGQSYYPPNLASVFAGSGTIPGDSLALYSSMVMIANNYSGDLEVFTPMMPLIMSYLNAGGNILLATRYGANFITGDLLKYGLSAGDSLVFNEIGANPAGGGLTTEIPGLVNITTTGAGWSLTDLLAPSTDPAVTKLFDTPDYPGSVGGIIIEPANKGKFVFIAGRPYRFEHTAMATDFGYILTHYFGE